MAHAEGKRMNIGLALVESRNLFLSREACLAASQAGGKATLYLVTFLLM